MACAVRMELPVPARLVEIAPALAAGNTVVLKPASLTPLTARSSGPRTPPPQDDPAGRRPTIQHEAVAALGSGTMARGFR